jgi:hypothetical protein
MLSQDRQPRALGDEASQQDRARRIAQANFSLDYAREPFERWYLDLLARVANRLLWCGEPS